MTTQEVKDYLKSLKAEEKADLRRADLSGADLRRADLRGADLRRADLSAADLRGANLRGANLSEADLRRADLHGANLRGADLSAADLSEADLRRADLHGANLRRADLSAADLSEANLRGADLRRANLSGAYLPHFQIVPAEGSFIAWKKTTLGVIKILVPEDAQRTSSLVGRKCRASHITVLGGPGCGGTGPNYSGLVYTAGETIHADSFDPDIRVECSHGIHFFMTEQEAKEWA